MMKSCSCAFVRSLGNRRLRSAQEFVIQLQELDETLVIVIRLNAGSTSTKPAASSREKLFMK
ncbi:MAG TPA: hypothetical protein VF773_11930 [Verrucomicrobiae bacterium]